MKRRLAGLFASLTLLATAQTAYSAPGSDLADQANAGWFAATAQLISVQPHAVVKTAGGSALMVSGFAQPRANGVFGIASNPDPAQLARFADELPSFNQPWVLRVRGDVSANPVAAAHGLNTVDHRSLTALPATEYRPLIGSPAGVTVRRVDGSAASTFLDIAVAATGVPADSVRNQFIPAVFDSPAASPYLVYVDGKPVASALAVRGGNAVITSYLFTLPAYAAHGYNVLAASAALRDAFIHGAKLAVAPSDPDVQPVLDALHFRAVDTWTTFS
ncbi:GNAT family N-acetyltransferase [Kutzneria sp. 744]|uniref:GNAT family N-acetyltransferase n=1 Tax=Kutzneria sp. (strain 744) TaxID=345341 RepID=UPI0003EEB831|nr:GNAT family N-acetyltransferase [Kutzneria sp. 744]EWM10831.1 mucin-2 [Kutzneria sp. 744]